MPVNSPRPSKSQAARMTLPAPGGWTPVPVKVTVSPTFTSARSEPFAVAVTTGWMPPRGLDHGSRRRGGHHDAW
jgi:hypothetical protein